MSHVGSVVVNNNKLDKQKSQRYFNNQQVERDINHLELQRKKVIKKRDNQLNALKNRGRWASNNLAGATWQQSLAQEMQAITQQADTLVSTIDRQIAQLKTEFR
ncbi:Predicted periplasmic protein (fragment) [Shewanella benthica]|uniref:Predicted periplasmic protein n=1 Tax=Shewanella benthica TaxID=43661 RepID=A0A330M649_9GAMM